MQDKEVAKRGLSRTNLYGEGALEQVTQYCAEIRLADCGDGVSAGFGGSINFDRVANCLAK